jgi:hypothetical protein
MSETEEEDPLPENTTDLRMFEQLIQMDTDQLAMTGRHDANALSQLAKFSSSLCDSVRHVERARQDEENAARPKSRRKRPS